MVANLLRFAALQIGTLLMCLLVNLAAVAIGSFAWSVFDYFPTMGVGSNLSLFVMLYAFSEFFEFEKFPNLNFAAKELSRLLLIFSWCVLYFFVFDNLQFGTVVTGVDYLDFAGFWALLYALFRVTALLAEKYS